MNLIKTIQGEKGAVPPLWMMRQAGRYLPGYQTLRHQHPDFMSLCLNSKAAIEITLEPIQRFDVDAAIVFADILMIPYAFGQSVRFEANQGPRLGPLPDLSRPCDFKALLPILQTLKGVRQRLDPSKALIGFAGAPWTVLSYMIERQGSKTYEDVKTFVYTSGDFEIWMERLCRATADYLIKQIESGADIVMLFDSWAGHLPHDLLDVCCIQPQKIIIQKVKAAFPHIPFISFPRQVSLEGLQELSAKVKPDVLALSNLYSPFVYARELPKSQVVQLGPDPVVLKVGGDLLKGQVFEIKKAFEDRPFIMNLSHGILPQTPVENVDLFIKAVRS